MANKDEKQTTSVPDADPKDALIEQLKKQLAEANAEKAATEKELETLKTAKTATAAGSVDPETVTIKLYKDQNIKDDVQVFVNGRQYIIRRGVEVAVPREVFEVLQNQEKMRNHIVAYNEKHATK